MHENVCIHCGKLIEWKANGPKQIRKYCNRKCGDAHYKTINLSLSSEYDLSTNTVGTMAELLVCYDLSLQGWEVFRAVSPSASCDMLIMKNGRLLRIEVRTGTRTMSGRLNYPKTKRDNERSDLIAVVIHKERSITYLPDQSQLLHG